MKRILAVIPARGGSKRIRNKNLRFIHGKPLVGHMIELALSVREIDRVVLSSDDPAILNYASGNGELLIRERPAELSRDEVTLDPVIYDAVLFAEERLGTQYDVVVTLQPTSPTLSAETLRGALSAFITGEADTVISVCEDNHLRWEMVDEVPKPQYKERLNRQWLPKTFRETGAFLIAQRAQVTEQSRIGHSISVFPVSYEESIDIDEPVDWILAESILSILRIAIVVDGNFEIGLGHVYRTMTLADLFYGNRVKFFTTASDDNSLALMRDRGNDVREIKENELLAQIKTFEPHIVINDILDTDRDYIEALIDQGYYVVNFEDLGEGSHCAHLVFNALYEQSDPPAHHRFGAKYVCLGSHFLITEPVPSRENASTLMITFGGADQNNLTVKAMKLLPTLFETTSLERAIVVLGPGYAHMADFEALCNALEPHVRPKIEIHKRVSNMAALMREADLAITSNGRTVYELASMGVPGISIAQNDRETLHLFSRYSKGFSYLGIWANVSDEQLQSTIEKIATDKALRLRMRESLLNEQLRHGVNRVKRDILEGYGRWTDERHSDR